MIENQHGTNVNLVTVAEKDFPRTGSPPIVVTSLLPRSPAPRGAADHDLRVAADAPAVRAERGHRLAADDIRTNVQSRGCRPRPSGLSAVDRLAVTGAAIAADPWAVRMIGVCASRSSERAAIPHETHQRRVDTSINRPQPFV